MLITKFNIYENFDDDTLGNLKRIICEEDYFKNNGLKMTDTENGDIIISGFTNSYYMDVPTYFRNLIEHLCTSEGYTKSQIYQGRLTLKKKSNNKEELEPLQEATQDNLVHFDDDVKLNYYKKLWNSLNIYKSVHNKFFKSLYDKMVEKRVLTRLQWAELEYLLKNGRSRYEAGIYKR